MTALHLGRRVRRIYRAAVRRRPNQLKIKVLDASTNNSRQELLAPAPGHRIRFIRAKVLQDTSDGRHLWELFFGDAGNIITAPNRAIDILAVPDQGSDATRTFLREEGPRGKRDEVLSGRWRGTAPTTVHKIVVEFSEET